MQQQYDFKCDHTVANILRQSLYDNNDVLFVGYSKKHPFDKFVEFKIKSKSCPNALLLKTISAIKLKCTRVSQEFFQELYEF